MRHILLSLTVTAALITTGYHTTQGQVRSVKKLINLRGPVNSMGDDFAPTLTGNGNTLIFNSRLRGEHSHNLYESRLTPKGWSKPVYMKLLNSPENDETPYITPDGKTIIFSSDRKGSKRPSVTADGMVRITYDLYISHRIDGRWTKPVPVPGDVNTTRNERCPSLSPDRRFLYFSRWRYSNIRRSVIMVAELKNNRYVNVRPLPETINRYSYDLALAPSRSGGFYFASRRPGGYGGWDLYFTKKIKDSWTKPVNLGPEINSPDNELFLSEAGSEIFFCSDRTGGLGGYDIYSSGIPAFVKGRKTSPPAKKDKDTDAGKSTPRRDKKIAGKSNEKTKLPETGSSPKKKQSPSIVKNEKKEPARVETENDYDEIIRHEYSDTTVPGTENKAEDTRTRIRFRVTSSVSGNPLTARFRVYLKDNDDPASLPLRTIKRKSGPKGAFTVYPKDDVTHVVVKIDEPGFTMKRTSVAVQRGAARIVNIELAPVPGKKYRLIFRPLYFGFKSSTIRIGYYPYLHKIIDYMRKNPETRLVITGHSDRRGSERANYLISIKRARAVKDYFVRMGLSQERFVVRGMGETKPLTWQPGDIFNELNRRVEFRLTEK